MDEAYNFLINDVGFKDGDSVVVACSGGPDSMALLSLVVKLKNIMNLKVVVAHINHNVRIESDSEKDFVYNYCISNGLVFEYMKIDNYDGYNFENEARDRRYKFFDELSSRYNCKYVLTAHHGDDLIETILMRIVRGSSLKGYSGFSRISVRGKYSIIRPLINVTKSEILDYNTSNGIDYVIDKTNFLDVHTRNRYRKYILPDLKKEDLNVHHKFYNFSNLLSEYDSFMDKYVDEIIDGILVDGILNISCLFSLDRIVVVRIINRLFEYYYLDKIHFINNRHVEMVYNVIFSSKPNSFIYLPLGFKGIRSYDIFYIVSDLSLSEYDYVFDNLLNLPNGKNIQLIKNTSLNDNNVIRLNSVDILLPLHVRTRIDGDRIFVKGMHGSKKVKDIFIDSKVPLNDRNSWPIVVDSSGTVVWIPGLKKSIFDRSVDSECDIILRYY
jgi:tRNA(Ile)-lysidine synthase